MDLHQCNCEQSPKFSKMHVLKVCIYFCVPWVAVIFPKLCQCQLIKSIVVLWMPYRISNSTLNTTFTVVLSIHSVVATWHLVERLHLQSCLNGSTSVEQWVCRQQSHWLEQLCPKDGWNLEIVQQTHRGREDVRNCFRRGMLSKQRIFSTPEAVQAGQKSQKGCLSNWLGLSSRLIRVARGIAYRNLFCIDMLLSCDC